MDKKPITACFTGHRKLSIPANEIRKRLSELLVKLISRGVIYYGCGGAYGFDFLAAEAVMDARRNDHRVKLILVLPCKDQDLFWHPEQRSVYQKLKTQADKVVYVSDAYHAGCMRKRNRHLVDHSSICISFLENRHSGTFYTYHYALRKGLELYNIAASTYLSPVLCFPDL